MPLFLTQIEIVPGKVDEVVALETNLYIPEGIKVKQFLKLFGKPDYMILYEAKDEKVALKFIYQFAKCAVTNTATCNPVVEQYEQK